MFMMSTLMFLQTLAAQENCDPTEILQMLTSTGIDPDATAEARLRTRADCDRDFQVQVQDVPVGDYALFVGDLLRGMITVVDNGLEIEGQIQFDDVPNDPGELLLDFDPADQLIEIRQGETVFFSAVLEVGLLIRSDISGDNLINFLDFAGLSVNWLSTNASADIDGSGTVDPGDLAILIHFWLRNINL